MAEDNKYTKELLADLVAMPLGRKVQLTQARIIEWYQHFDGKVVVNCSGGKDSTVLLDIARQVFPDIKAVFSNTGLEYPEIQKFVAGLDNVDVVYPKMKFTDVISTYGYPIISKEVAEAIYYARRILPPEREREREDLLGMVEFRHPHTHTGGQSGPEGSFLDFDEGRNGNETGRVASDVSRHEREDIRFSGWDHSRRRCLLGVAPEKDSHTASQFNKKKWLPLCREAPFFISHYCCNVMKKSPLKKYQSENHVYPILGTMTEESRLRKQAWLRHGCNAFDSTKKTSQPMSFWTEQDVLEYIYLNHLNIAPVYGDIIAEPQGEGERRHYHCTGCQRTGCVFCGFGFHMEKKGTTRFQRLAYTHPQQYEYCLGGGQWVDNPKYNPAVSVEPDELGWVNWNPKKIWVPSKQGLGMKFVFDTCNAIYGKDFMRYE